MIPKLNKFPTRAQFLSFRASAEQFASPHLRIMYKTHSPSRLSVIVPIKVNKRAVMRNHLRRLVYDNAWKVIAAKKIDCIILFKPLPLLKGRDLDEHITQEVVSALSSIKE